MNAEQMQALAARLREHAKPLRRSGQMTHDHIADDLDRAADLIDQMFAYGRDCERAAHERAAQVSPEVWEFPGCLTQEQFDCLSALEGADREALALELGGRKIAARKAGADK